MIRILTTKTALKHKKILNQTKGFYNKSNKTYKTALIKFYKALTYKTIWRFLNKRVIKRLITYQLNSFLQYFGGIKLTQLLNLIQFTQLQFSRNFLLMFLFKLEKLTSIFYFFKAFKLRILNVFLFRQFKEYFFVSLIKTNFFYYFFILLIKFSVLHNLEFFFNLMFFFFNENLVNLVKKYQLIFINKVIFILKINYFFSYLLY